MASSLEKKQIDAKILELLQTRRRQGFELLFHTYYSEVCQHIYRIYPKSDVVEDIAQDIFLTMWKKGKDLRIQTSPGAYLYRAAVTRTLNYLRDNKNTRFETEDELKTKAANDTTADDVLAHGDLAQWLTKSIDRLPPRCRQVFVLSRFEQMTYREIGEAMEISAKTVENQMTKALKHLRESYVRFQSDEIGGVDQ